MGLLNGRGGTAKGSLVTIVRDNRQASRGFRETAGANNTLGSPLSRLSFMIFEQLLPWRIALNKQLSGEFTFGIQPLFSICQ